MILDTYQCSSCYFEDKEPSTRIDPSTISPAQSRVSFNDVLVVFVCVERYDSRQELEEVVNEFGSLANLLGKRPIVLCPNVHLSIDKAPEKQAIALITELEKMLKERGYEVHRLSFGYHKKYGLECNGNVGSVVGRRFYGSEHKQFLRLMTRLGVCPAGVAAERHAAVGPRPDGTPVEGARQPAGNLQVAKKMLEDQLDATGNGELWTCMLFEGERQPMEDYLSQLQTILQDYPDVRVHRAMNLSVPGFSNAARHLFRRFPEAIESGRLRIYNSKVSDLEFLLSRRRRAAGLSAEAAQGGFPCGRDFLRHLLQGRRLRQESDSVVSHVPGRCPLRLDSHRGRPGHGDQRVGRGDVSRRAMSERQLECEVLTSRRCSVQLGFFAVSRLCALSVVVRPDRPGVRGVLHCQTLSPPGPGLRQPVRHVRRSRVLHRLRRQGLTTAACCSCSSAWPTVPRTSSSACFVAPGCAHWRLLHPGRRDRAEVRLAVPGSRGHHLRRAVRGLRRGDDQRRRTRRGADARHAEVAGRDPDRRHSDGRTRPSAACGQRHDRRAITLRSSAF